MTRLERREQALRRLILLNKDKTEYHTVTSGHKKRKVMAENMKTHPTIPFTMSEALPYTPPEYHHHISPSRNFPIHIHTFLNSTRVDDPAVVVGLFMLNKRNLLTHCEKKFHSKLHDHLLGRILHPTWSADPNEYSTEEHGKICIVNNRLFLHKVMRINYTTYDVRQGQDAINPRNHADIMTLSRHDNDHPFEYARVIGIFHVDVIHGVEGATQHPISKEVLWVRRFRRDRSYRAGFQQKRLHRLEFISSRDDSAFGFLDPDEVIRASHLIPAFSHGPTEEFLSGESFGRAPGELDDYRYFYINMLSISFLSDF